MFVGEAAVGDEGRASVDAPMAAAGVRVFEAEVEEFTADIDSALLGLLLPPKGFFSMFITCCWRPFTEGRPRVARLFREP